MATEELVFAKAEYIKIFEYKKVSVGSTFHDVLRLDEIAFSSKKPDECEYTIESGKYKGKKISKLFTGEDEQDFYCLPLTTVEINLVTDFNPDKKEKITLDNYLKKCPNNEYLEVIYNGDNPTLNIITDKKIIDGYKYAATPSVNKTLGDLIEGAKESGTLSIDAITASKILGKSNELSLQDPKKHIKSLDEYDAMGKYLALKKRLVGLDDQLKVLIANLTKNISLSYSGMSNDKIRELKSNLLIYGPPGSGKTFMMASASNLFGVPFVIEDATRYTPAAYKGADIEDILVNLYNAAGKNKEAFEHGIIFIDEFDKICKYTNSEDSEIKQDTQNAFLTMMQGTVIHKKIGQGMGEQNLEFDTSNITFVLAGAFEGILNKGKIETDDLVAYGMIRQLADRIKETIMTTEPTKEELRTAILSSEYSYLSLLKEYFEIYGIDLEVTDEFIEKIVDEAYTRKSGYRGLSAAITRCINDVLFDIYSSKQTTVKLQIK